MTIAVVAATGDALDYAGCLTRLVETCGAVRGGIAVPAIADGRSRLSRRVHLLVASRPAAAQLPMRIAAAAMPLALTALVLAKAPAVITVSTPTPVPAFTLVQQAKPPIAPTIATKEKPMSHRLQRAVQAAALASAVAVSVPAAPSESPAPAQETRFADRQLVALFFPTALLHRYQVQTAVAAARQFIGERKGATIAVLSYSDSVKVVQDFTDDPVVLNAALDKVAALLPGTAIGSTDLYLATIGNTVRMLGVLPNKKVLVYFAPSEDFKPGASAAQIVINDAIRNNVALYPVDVNGKGN